ncbi:FecR domain-containing protein [Parasphingopyxis sp. CP4]|uniref:FecR family protein n=1 Tax=Parasphingopyxis sp. CP4 TaxID=2724527 RepID=UPI0015A20612|nr:FecR family protein [Parasphingopyxis sp. CP4]QLC22283.1 FecR domain-containing protein [Parasphingopyxis sp. CP4]
MRKLIYCAIPALLAASQPAWADGPRWQVSEASGDVQVMRAGVSRAATRGGMLYAGDILVTGNRGRAVVTRGEEYMIVSPSSRLRMPGDTRSGGITQIIEEIGNVIYNVQRRNHQHFSVETPYLAAVVKGTTFSVTVDENGSSVQVLEGLVEVSTLDGGASDLVEPGEVALVATGDRYRLTVEGDETTVIESPNAPEGGVTTPAVSAPNTVTAAVTVPVAGFSTGEIQSEIRAAPVSVGMLTNGLVAGDTETGADFVEARNGGESGTGGRENAIIFAMGSDNNDADGDGNNGHGNDADGFDESNPGNGPENGNGAENGNGGSGNGGGAGNGNGSGAENGGGAGNGNGSGTENGNGAGNGNGSGAENGGGAGNGGGAENGNGNGNSNGNGNGNGNGNSGGDGNNGHGNDDGGVDNSNPGNGNGHGNGNGGGAGNGNGNGGGNRNNN